MNNNERERDYAKIANDLKSVFKKHQFLDLPLSFFTDMVESMRWIACRAHALGYEACERDASMFVTIDEYDNSEIHHPGVFSVDEVIPCLRASFKDSLKRQIQECGYDDKMFEEVRKTVYLKNKHTGEIYYYDGDESIVDEILGDDDVD